MIAWMRWTTFRTGLVHMSLNLTVTTTYVVNFLWRQGSYGTPAGVGTGTLVLSATSLAALAVSGYLGGKLAYRYGVRVADEATQATGYQPTKAEGAVSGDPRPAH